MSSVTTQTIRTETQLILGELLTRKGDSNIFRVQSLNGKTATVTKFTGNRHERRKALKRGTI